MRHYFLNKKTGEITVESCEPEMIPKSPETENPFAFGDYALIEQKRYGVDNEMYLHKVIGTLKSNSYVDVPVKCPATETLHIGVVDVVACVCCGIDERDILRYRTDSVNKPETHNV